MWSLPVLVCFVLSVVCSFIYFTLFSNLGCDRLNLFFFVSNSSPNKIFRETAIICFLPSLKPLKTALNGTHPYPVDEQFALFSVLERNRNADGHNEEFRPHPLKLGEQGIGVKE